MVKKGHERFGEIIREHFDAVQPAEFNARLHDASNGAFGEPSTARDESRPPQSKMKRLVRAAGAVASRMMSMLHLQR